MVFIRRIKKKSGTYLAEVEGYRFEGKVKQRVIRYLGKEINGKPEKRVLASEIEVKNVKRSFDVLVVDTIAKELGITELENKSVLALVYSQVLEKYSINQLEEWMRFSEIPDVLGIKQVSTKSLYESLGDVDEKEIEMLSRKLCDIFSKRDESSDVAVIDVTDTYFAGSQEKIKRRRGKDSKVEKLIQVGLAVTFKNGFPLFHKKYHGNLNNVHIFKDMALELKARGLRGVIVDRGMTSDDNIALAKELHLKIIGGIKKTTTIIETYLSTIKREELYSLKYRIPLKNTTVFATSFSYEKGKLIVVYNPALEIIKKEQRFEKGVETDDPHLGFSLIYHNTKYDVAEVVKQYYDKEIVERAFKQLKGVLSLRPIRVWLKNHVEGHVNICYLAYAILAYMNYKLKKTNTTATDALRSLKHGYRVTLKTTKEEWSIHVPLEPHQKQLLKALGVVYKK
jgi:transposase